MTIKERITACLELLGTLADSNPAVSAALYRFTHIGFIIARSAQTTAAKWQKIEAARLGFLDSLEAIILDLGREIPYSLTPSKAG